MTTYPLRSKQRVPEVPPAPWDLFKNWLTDSEIGTEITALCRGWFKRRAFIQRGNTVCVMGTFKPSTIQDVIFFRLVICDVICYT